jgi:acyl-coenzyme A thioesterase PaaI-like protein
VSPERLVHHELCFGCGRTNLFGLLMDVEPAGPGEVRGRGFIKQDHQGPSPGSAHEGIVMAALCDVMALACGARSRASRLELRLEAPVPIGSFLDVRARAGEVSADGIAATATASVNEQPVARARGVFREI